MLFSLGSTVLGLVALTRAVDHAVGAVDGPGGIVAYNPPSVTAAVGDTVTFIFQQKNHTITRSSLENPCSPLPGGFDSAFQPVSAADTPGSFHFVTLMVNDTAPIWMYCRQMVPISHCAAGMVFAINPGPGQLAAFQAAATATGNPSNATATSAAYSGYTPPNAASTSAAASASTTPTDHKVLVGNGGMLSYSPPNITAQVGDTITFEFKAKNHTISRSSFAAPCQLLGSTSGAPGFDSGFTPVAANSTLFPTYTITVNDTNPIWAYCRQTNPSSHCGAGMVFAANAVEGSSKSFEAFVALAMQLNGTNSGGTNSTSNGTSTGNGTSSGNSTSNSIHANTPTGQIVVALVTLALGVLAAL